MHAIPASSAPSFAALPAVAAASSSAPTSSDTGSSSGSGDLLAAMNPAMDAAFAVGRPTDSGGAASILATTGSYIQGANATIGKLDQGIEAREKTLERLRQTDPEAATKAEGQLELLKRLRDRIQLSVERVSQTLAGGDSGDGGRAGGVDDERELDERRRKREELELLEQRRQLLAPVSIQPVTAVDTSMVAGTYAAAGAGAVGGVSGGGAGGSAGGGGVGAAG